MDISHITDFLLCRTPQAWIDEAAKAENRAVLLTDHANCELKAAQQAQATIMRYKSGAGPVDGAGTHKLLNKMSRLAREELRHFEQVIGIMQRRGIDYVQLSASRYAVGLRAVMRGNEPGRAVDTLLAGAIIEARSCERFASLIDVLDGELAEFYASLLKSEARHFKDYLLLAREAAGGQVDDRLAILLAAERELIESPDGQFRFHSGSPA